MLHGKGSEFDLMNYMRSGMRVYAYDPALRW